VLSGLGLSSLVFGLTAAGGHVIPGLPSGLLIITGGVLVSVYAWHAKRVEAPILDLKLLALPSYRTSIIGGFVFRAAVGAMPFLLPMMLQVGFGLTPFESGSLTFASALGMLFTKFTMAPVLRRFGFRRVLVSSTIVGAISIAAVALFTPITPHYVIFAVLLTGGFFRALQITSLETVAYADVPSSAMSRASSISSVSKHLSASVGIALAALILEVLQEARGDELFRLNDFKVAFVLVAILAVSSLLMILRLAHNVGTEISGHGSASGTVDDTTTTDTECTRPRRR
jgi:MFS family permease